MTEKPRFYQLQEKAVSQKELYWRELINRYLFDINRFFEPVFMTGAKGIKKEAAEFSGIQVEDLKGLNLANFHFGHYEDKTQKQIYDQHGENGGITPFRRDATSPPVVLELATDKARGVIKTHEVVLSELTRILPVKIEEFKRQFPQFAQKSQEEIIQALIANDSDIGSLFLILQKTGKFFTADSTWGLYFPEGTSITTDHQDEGIELIHKPKDPNILIGLLEQRVNTGVHLRSISGRIDVEYRYDVKLGRVMPFFRKRMIVVDYEKITRENIRFIEFVRNAIDYQKDYALGLSSADLTRMLEEFGLNGRKIKILIYDYTDNEGGDKNYIVSEDKNKKPEVQEFELSFNEANYSQIVALSLGIIP
ncbi:MAG: hypothetical protein N2593_01065 [Patescibacteria group bacterium]|nr:hypothetical protein [Patescibacteria group bacterium]